jgi:teichoic acid transport system ATP-binding protein
MDKNEIAVQVSHLNKRYKLYARNRDRVADAFGLKSHYSEHMALNDVSMTVYRGETVGIIGTNGSGKSTILKIITGVLNPTSGDRGGARPDQRAAGAGRRLQHGVQRDREHLPQRNDDRLSPRQEIDREDWTRSWTLPTSASTSTSPSRLYSSGMFMRLAFAVAINIEPEILIVDEALSVGDVSSSRPSATTNLRNSKKKARRYCSSATIFQQREQVLRPRRASPEPGREAGRGLAQRKMIDIYKQVLVGQYDPKTREIRKVPDGLSPDDQIMAAAARKADEADSKIRGESADRLEKQKAAAEHLSVSPEGTETGTADRGTADRNAETLEYGSGKAVIREYGVIDDRGNPSTTVMKGSSCSVWLKVKILQDIAAPIFAFTIRNVYGVEICGTNTMIEKAFLEPVKKPERKRTITFTQKIDLQGGEYLISLGVHRVRDRRTSRSTTACTT